MKKAFTLTEVLITLGIIGVVSAMTIPTLVKNHQRQVYVTQLQKVVNELSQAAEKATNDSNAISLDETKYRYNENNNVGAANFLRDYFKIAKDCGTTLTPCFADSYETLNGENFTLEEPQAVVSLTSGAAISIFNNRLDYQGSPYWTDENGVRHYEPYHGAFQIQVDINGQKEPNILGRDLFYMELYSDGKVAETYSGARGWGVDNPCAEGDTYGIGCFDTIVNDGWKMDY